MTKAVRQEPACSVNPSPENSPWKKVGNQLKLSLDQDELTHCMRCGFCLPACPTYRETGLEAASPRGRIALMKAVSDGLMTPDQTFDDQMNLCLGCRACESACPADVKFGRLLEQARAGIAEHGPKPRRARFLRSLIFRHLFPKQGRLRFIGAVMAFYQRSGLRWLFHQTRLSKGLPEPLRQMDRVLPPATSKGITQRLGIILPARGKPRGRVGLFRGCIMDVIFADTNEKTARILSAAGYEVVIPPAQQCCGALQAHAGEERESKKAARHNIRVFREAKVDWIASNAGGCGAQLKEYPYLLREETDQIDDARWFSERVKDVSELIASGLPLPLGKVNRRITYQDSCHLGNGMGCHREPRELLNSIPGLDFIELFESDRCCGSAGIYNITHPEMSMNILDQKMNHVGETKADLLVTSNPGCLLQMQLGIRRAGLEDRIEAIHLIDLLAASVETAEKKR
ncbi:(Fe-S)-binding protein [Paludifilum halophilum]|uniref:Glycolate oxidase iron-sulfur subunit n=1 Tax=Paludifilum halophilum TaxID=1642702 RepID=A0A235B5F9_9BACL|nr:(Fe-S)-binding protein [Paludifilum halophilum]OYD07209.1 glycolate oxidase [Paludifilum halophilum]